MELSRAFGLDPCEPWVQQHNQEVQAVLQAWQADRPIRVPLLCGEWFGQHGFYADEVGLDYGEYYTDPDLMLRVQLEAARRRRELPIYDMALAEAPQAWPMSVDFWPVVAPGWVGCELVYRKDAVIAHRGLGLSRERCDQLQMPDPARGGVLGACHEFWQRLRRHEGPLRFLGRPIGPVAHGVGINGIFSLALDLRGPDLMIDMMEHAPWAHEFLGKVGRWCDVLTRTWAQLAGVDIGPFSATDHGIDMLSAQVYERFIIPLLLRLNRERGFGNASTMHHCGRGAHLFPVVQKHLGLATLDMLTYPLTDIAKVRREVGPQVWIYAAIEEGIVQQGPPQRIAETVKALMQSGAMGQGRLALKVGDMLKGTLMAHRLALYEAVKEYGRYSPGP